MYSEPDAQYFYYERTPVWGMNQSKQHVRSILKEDFFYDDKSTDEMDDNATPWQGCRYFWR